MAEYEMQEMNLINEEGKQVLYPRLVITERANTDYLVKHMSQNSTFSKAEVIGFLQHLAEHLSYQLSEGKSVKIDGIGTFTPSLIINEGKERETGEDGDARRNAQSISIGKINFRADKSLLRSVNRQCILQRSQREFKRSSQKYTPEQRLELARQYLDRHSFIRVSDYAGITGLRPTTASLELKKWTKLPDSGITVSGKGTHKVYVKNIPYI